MIIYKEDSEEQKQSKRRVLAAEMANDHYLGSLLLSTGTPIGCKVEQPKEQRVHIRTSEYKIGASQFCNGEVRCAYINGHNRKELRMGFAGRARSGGEMNGGEGEGGWT